ncbi:hypothetical protein [Proteus phage RP7]|nr:hypothetical protein [Proteus phage RP7]
MRNFKECSLIGEGVSTLYEHQRRRRFKEEEPDGASCKAYSTPSPPCV